MLTYIRYGLKHMKHRKLRAWLTIVGVVIGIAAIISLISVGEGLENAINEQFEKMGISSIRVVPKGLRGPPVGVEGLTTKDVDVVEKIVGVDYATPILAFNEQVHFGSEEQLKRIIAYPVQNAEGRFADVDMKFMEGRAFTESEKDGLLVGYEIAKEDFDKEMRIRNTLKIKGKKFRIVGIFEEAGVPMMDQSIYMPIDTARDLFDEPDLVSGITLQLKKGVNIDNVAKDVKKKLKRARDDENFEVFTPEQMLAQLGDILKIVRFILAGIAGISLLVGGIGILNAMYTSVLERTREVGVMKAIGATNFNIMGLFLMESGMIGLTGGLVGAILGIFFAFSVELIAAQLGFGLISISINWSLIAFALGFAFTVGVVSGTLPAWRAAKLQPIEALRDL
jgi:putative ABC transport system permease protein